LGHIVENGNHAKNQCAKIRILEKRTLKLISLKKSSLLFAK
jgi:hypothetical protein